MNFNQPDFFHPSFDPAIQPFCRNSDPDTSAEAAKSRSTEIKDVHFFVLRHHLQFKDTDRNAGEAAVKAGHAADWEEGRRASRTVKEKGWVETFIDSDGKLARTVNNSTGKKGLRHRITEQGSAALMDRPIS